MPSDCEIFFDHQNGVYNSGETLNGNIKLTTTSSKTIRAVSIKIHGYAKVRWTERKSRRQNGKTVSYTVVYEAHQLYLNSETFVVGGENGDSFELLPGIYNHAFACELPLGVPTSCQGQYGEIKYEVIVNIDRPFLFDNTFKQAFTVIQPLNLNLDPNLKTPQKGEDNKSSCCCSCQGSGNIQAKLHVPFSGYAPGQKISFHFYIFNDTNTDIDRSKVKFEKCITFESHRPSHKHKYNNFEIGSKQFGEVLRLTRKEFTGFIVLPSIPPSTQESYHCVRISYLLKAKVFTGCCSTNMVISIPITIGTVPLYQSATNPTNVITVQPTAPVINQNEGSASGTDLPPAYYSLAPPSYEESIAIAGKFEDEDNDNKHKEMPFVPKYPVYYNFAAGPGSGQTPAAQSNTNNEIIQPSDTNYGWTPRQ